MCLSCLHKKMYRGLVQLNTSGFTAHLPFSETGELRVRFLRAVEGRPAAGAVVRSQREGNAVAHQQGNARQLHQHPPERDPGHKHPQPIQQKPCGHGEVTEGENLLGAALEEWTLSSCFIFLPGSCWV